MLKGGDNMNKTERLILVPEQRYRELEQFYNLNIEKSNMKKEKQRLKKKEDKEILENAIKRFAAMVEQGKHLEE